MEKAYVRDLIVDSHVDSPFLVAAIEVAKKRNGEDFLKLTLADRTGEVRAVMWDDVREAADTVSPGDYAQATGKVALYQERPQVVVSRLRRLEPDQLDEADFVPASGKNVGEMWSELEKVIASVGRPELRRLLEDVFSDEGVAERFRRAPAAKHHHHVFRGGLLEHTLSLVRLGEFVAGHYPLVDRDLLLAGVLLHDLGKISELRYEREFEYSDEGRLVGHIVMAAADLDGRMRKLSFPDALRARVLHMVVSHHGLEEFGSPRKPMTPEAIALHHLDMLDSRLEIARAAIERDADRDGSFTDWVRSLERPLYKAD